MTVTERLFTLQDTKYRDFHSKLIPNIDKERVIGIRTPMLRQFAKEFWKKPEAEDFLAELPHDYYEENNLHSLLIEPIKDYDKAISLTDEFLPYIDNWATCDLMSPKIFARHTDELFIKINEWINSEQAYTVRYGLGMLMRYFLDEKFEENHLELASKIISNEYYINMMIAWYFATALAKQYSSAIKFIEQKKLTPWVHNKTIQKAIESFRVSPEHKAYLRTLRLNLKK